MPQYISVVRKLLFLREGGCRYLFTFLCVPPSWAVYTNEFSAGAPKSLKFRLQCQFKIRAKNIHTFMQILENLEYTHIQIYCVINMFLYSKVKTRKILNDFTILSVDFQSFNRKNNKDQICNSKGQQYILQEGNDLFDALSCCAGKNILYKVHVL